MNDYGDAKDERRGVGRGGGSVDGVVDGGGGRGGEVEVEVEVEVRLRLRWRWRWRWRRKE